MPMKPLMIVLAGWAATAGAQVSPPAAAPAPAAVASSSPRFALKGFALRGDNPLGEARAQAVLAPFLRDDATLESLQQATAALEAALRAEGYGLHRVALPPQEVGDTVTLQIVHFSLGQVSVEGNSYYDVDNIRRSLPELREQSTPNFKRLAVQAAIANDNPSKQVQVSLRESKVPDHIDASIRVKESQPWNFSTSWSNAGSAASGRDRLTFAGGHSNLFNRDHQFVGAYTTSLENTGGVKQIGLSYRVPVYELDGVLGASFTQSDVVGNFGAFSSTGAGQTLGLSYTRHLPPDGGYRSYVTLGLDDKSFDAVAINGTPLIGQSPRRSRPLRAAYSARKEADDAVWSYSAEFAANLGWGGNNSPGAYASEDPRINSAAWKALRGSGSYSARFGADWSWSARTQWQWADRPVIAGEQFGLGGVGSVRGAGERPIAADRGLSVSLELIGPALAENLRLLAFFDAGWLSNAVANTTNKPGNDQLQSVGLGLRYAVGKVTLSADYGRIVKGSSVPSNVNSLAPKAGNDKLHLQMVVQF